MNDNNHFYAIWKTKVAAGLHILDQKQLFLVGSDANCDIRFPDSMLSPLHATVRLSTDNNRRLFLVVTGEAMVYLKRHRLSVTLSRNNPSTLFPGDVITVSQNRNKVEVAIKREESPGQALRDLIDEARPYCYWKTCFSHYVRYLDDKDEYFIRDSDDGDIWIPYERLYAKLYRFNVNGITKYMLEKSPYHGCSVLVNDDQLANKKWLSSGDIISSGHHGTRLVFHAITSSREVLAAELIGSRQVPSASNEVQPQSSSGGDDPLEMNPLSSGEQAQEANVRMNSLLRRALIVQRKLERILHLEEVSRTSSEVIEEHFTCSICYEIFNNAVNVIPCNHVFCLRCVSRWTAAAPLYPTCPECRTPILDVKKSALINSFVAKVQPYWSERSSALETVGPAVRSLEEVLLSLRQVVNHLKREINITSDKMQ